MARKATAAQKRMAKKFGIRVTKTLRGKRVPKTAEQLVKEIETAKRRKARAKATAASKRSKQTTSGLGSTYSKKDDGRIMASTSAGKRKSKKYSTITYRTKDPKTGKIVLKKVRRRNANQTGEVTGGRTYVERRKNRTDKGRY